MGRARDKKHVAAPPSQARYHAAASTVTKPPRMHWTYDMRLVIHMLFSDRDISPAQRHSIFSKIFEREIKRAGFSDGGVSKRQLFAQNADRRPKVWTEICGPPINEEERTKRSYYASKIQSHSGTTSAPSQAELSDQPNASRLARPGTLSGVASSPSSRRIAAAAYATPISLKRDFSAAAAPAASPLASATPTEKPLSQRTPIAHYVDYDDEATSNPSPSSPDRGLLDSRPFLKYARKTTVGLQPPSEDSALHLSTPKPPNRTLRATIPYARPTDAARGSAAILLTPEEHAKTQLPLTPVSAKLAHPKMHGLLFRLWTDTLHDSASGHVARKVSLHVPLGDSAAPNCEMLCWRDLINHFDTPNKDTWAGPYISTTNCIAWSFRQAMKRARSGQGESYISVISVAELNPDGIYHAHPYYTELCKKRPFYGGAWRYNGYHEFLVWEKIPKTAIIKTIKVSDILGLGNDPILGRMLRLDLLASRGDFKTVILPKLRAMKVPLCCEAADAIAKFAHFMGLDAYAESAHISHLVCDLIQGWGLCLRREDWGQVAAVFARGLESASNHILRSSESARLEMAFLDGVRWSSSCHSNTMHNAEFVRLMQRRAKMIGLEDPAKLLHDQLEASSARMSASQSRMKLLLHGRSYQKQGVRSALRGGAMREEDQIDSDDGDNVNMGVDAVEDDEVIEQEEDEEEIMGWK